MRVVSGWIREFVDHSSDSSARAGGIALADQLVASATNFLTGVVVGRFSTPQEFGLYTLGFSIVFLVMRLQMALISTPYMVFSPHLTGTTRARYTGSTLAHQLGISLLAILILVLGGAVLSWWGVGPEGLAAVVWALAISISFILLRDYVRNVCFSHLDFVTVFVLDLCISIIQIGGLLLLAARGYLSARAAFLVIGLACGLAVTAWFIRAKDSLILLLSEVITDFKRNWNFGRWIFASGLLWESSLSLYPWVLTFFHGTASTGVWAACFGVVAVGNPVLLGMQNFLGPKIAHSFVGGDTESLRKLVFRYSTIFTILVLPISCIIMLFGDRFVIFIYGEKYAGYSLVLFILAADLLIAPVRFALSRAFFVMEQARLEFFTNFVPLFVLIVFGISLVRYLSVVGVASGILIGDILVTGVKYAAFEVLVRSANRNIGSWN